MKEIIYTEKDLLYHGTKVTPSEKIKSLGINHKYEGYSYLTPDPKYAATYAFKKRGITSWIPKRPIKILVVDSDFIRQVIKKYGNEHVSEDMLLYSFEKTAKCIMNPVNRKRKALEEVKRYESMTSISKNKSFSWYDIFKSMQVKEFFGEGDRWADNFNKILVPRQYDSIKNKYILSKIFRKSHYASANIMRKTQKIGKNKISNIESSIAISKSGKGFQRLSSNIWDFIVVYYMMKYAMSLNYDGIQMVTNGYVGNDGQIYSESPEIIIKKNGLLKRGPEYYWNNKLFKIKNAPDLVMPNKTKYKAGALIIFTRKDNGKLYVLIQLRSKYMKAPLHWTVPGGGKDKADRGSFATTALREAYEETGMHFESNSNVKEVWSDKKHKIKYYTLTVPNTIKIDKKIISDVELANVDDRSDWPLGSVNSPAITKGHKWVPVNRIDTLSPPMFDNLITIIKKAAGENVCVPAPAPAPVRTNIKQMKVANLKQYARNKGIKGFSGLKKANLQKLILKSKSPATAPAPVRTNIKKMKVANLKQYAKNKGIKLPPGRLLKANLQKLILESPVKNRKIFEIVGDGECLFNAIAFAIIYTRMRKQSIKNSDYKPLARQLRKIAVDELKKITKTENWETNSIIQGMLSNNRINSKLSEKNRIDNYLKMMSQSSVWGGDIEIKALTKKIHQLGFKGIQVYNGANFEKIKEMKTSTINNSKQFPIIKLALSNVQRGGFHFNFFT